jgi:plastocyanin
MHGKPISGSLLVVCFVIGITGCTSTVEKKGAGDTETGKVKSTSHVVEMAMMKFTPATLSVHKGDTIVFVNNDIVVHDVTEQKGKDWSSSPLATGKSWTLVATTTVDYYCSIHPVMTGNIIVE